MPCTLLHIMERPDEAPYEDPPVKDVVGKLPLFYCAYCAPLKRLPPHEAVKCLEVHEPCWKPSDQICD